jgi:hypothetical protein
VLRNRHLRQQVGGEPFVHMRQQVAGPLGLYVRQPSRGERRLHLGKLFDGVGAAHRLEPAGRLRAGHRRPPDHRRRSGDDLDVRVAARRLHDHAVRRVHLLSRPLRRGLDPDLHADLFDHRQKLLAQIFVVTETRFKISVQAIVYVALGSDVQFVGEAGQTRDFFAFSQCILAGEHLRQFRAGPRPHLGGHRRNDRGGPNSR